MGTRPVRVLGFPVTVNPGFVAFLLLLVALNRSDLRYGLVVGATFGAFTLLHELGHALVARTFAADTTISLDFLVGLADITPTRRLSRLERAAITAAGPLSAVAVSLLVLVASGAPLLTLERLGDGRFSAAVRWTGLALGLLNLAPLTPLDGGNLVALFVDRVAPGRGRVVMNIASLIACLVGTAVIVVRPRWWPWLISVALVAAWNVAALVNHRRANRLVVDTSGAELASDAERAGWADPSQRHFPAPWSPSPWLRAHRHLMAGDTGDARDILVASLVSPSGAWVLPSGASTDELNALVALLPDAPPVDQLHGAWALQSILHRLGFLRRSADYGARLYARHRAPDVAHLVARSLAQLGDLNGAIEWLTVAHRDGADLAPLDDEPELAFVRDDPRFAELRASVAVRAERVARAARAERTGLLADG